MNNNFELPLSNLEKQQKALEYNILDRCDRKLINKMYDMLSSGQPFKKFNLGENNEFNK